MKVISDRAALQDAVNVVNGVVVGRTPTPVLQCMKITAEEGHLTSAATDLEVGLKIGIDQVDVDEPGSVLVPADKLVQIVRACDDPALTLRSEDHTLVIQASGSRFKIFGIDPKEAPPVRDLGEGPIDCEIPAGALDRLVSRTLFAAAAEHSRYAINGVLFDRKGTNLRMVATDGRRLAVATGTCSVGKGDSTCIVPAKALHVLGRLIDDPETPIQVVIEENQIVFAIGSGPDAAILSSNLVEGAFPPFEDVIPREQDKRVRCVTSTLSSAIRRAALLTNQDSKGVRMSFDSDRLTLTSRAPEMGEAEVEVALEDYEGEPLEIGFNPGYIVDALKVVDADEVIVELKAPTKPGVIRMGNEFTYVLMPVNLS